MGWCADGSQGPRGVSSQIWEARGGFWRRHLLKLQEGFQEEATDSTKAWSGSWACPAREPRASGKDWIWNEEEVRLSRRQGPPGRATLDLGVSTDSRRV